MDRDGVLWFLLTLFFSSPQTPDSDGLGGNDVFEQIAAHEKEVERDDEPLPIAVDDGQYHLIIEKHFFRLTHQFKFSFFFL
jgi:hypothetical protein